MTSAFFSRDIVTQLPEAEVKGPLKKETKDVCQLYEISRCRKWIESGNYSRVAIQLPDELLCDSAMIVQALEANSSAKYFILGDTSYGSCCVDEVAAQHGSADCVIHFGQACLSPTKRLPVLYVFGEKPLRHEAFQQSFHEQVPDTDSRVVLMYDTFYAYAADEVHKELCKMYKYVLLSRLQIPGSMPDPNPGGESSRDPNPGGESSRDPKPGGESSTGSLVSRCNRVIQLPDSEGLGGYCIFYIGSEGLTLTNLMMNFNSCAFYTFDPETGIGRKETLNVNKALMKRYYMIERIKDSNIIGIVAGTLGVADYLQIINRLKKLIKLAGKKSYTFVVGKLNVAKLANFMEIDLFVLVSCPENTLIDSSEFYKPVVTPFEVEVALNQDRSWTGDYVTDFQQLLPGAAEFVEMPDSQDMVVTDVSLISNQMRSLGTEEITSTSTAVVTRNQNMSITTLKPHTAGEFLDARSWQGLEPSYGNTPVSKATEGMKGIAASYENEDNS